MTRLLKKKSSNDYLYVDEDTGKVVATYGEQVREYNPKNYIEVEVEEKKLTGLPSTNERNYRRYLAYIKSGHTHTTAQQITGYKE